MSYLHTLDNDHTQTLPISPLLPCVYVCVAGWVWKGVVVIATPLKTSFPVLSEPTEFLPVSVCLPPCLSVCLALRTSSNCVSVCVSVVVNHSEKMSAWMWSCPSGRRRPATSLNDFCPAVLPACWDTLTIYQIKHLMHLWAIKAQCWQCRHDWPKCARIRLHNTCVFPKWSCCGLDERHLWQHVEAWARPAWCAGDQEEEAHVEFVVDKFWLLSVGALWGVLDLQLVVWHCDTCKTCGDYQANFSQVSDL